MGFPAGGDGTDPRAGSSEAPTLVVRGGRGPLPPQGGPVEGLPPAWAAEQIAVGAFTNAGQLCTSVERVYLHADVADAVLAELVRRAGGRAVGSEEGARSTTVSWDDVVVAPVDVVVVAPCGFGLGAAVEQATAMLDRLPAKVSEAFCLAQIDGLSYREIAQRIGVSERTVTKYIGQAMFQCMVLEAELDGALS